PAGEVKTQLTAEIKKAQDLLDKKNQEAAAEKAAKEAVNNLFTDGTHASLNTKTTQATIDGAKKTVDALPAGEVKTQLTAEIKKAQDLLDKKNQEAAAEKAAKEAVNNLFADGTHALLNTKTTQATINEAKKAVDALPSGEVKTQLTAEIKKAQDLLDKKNQESAAEQAAKTAVNNLFTDDAHTALNGNTTQATINGAKKAVDVLPSGEVKTQLTAEIQKAQDLFNQKDDDYWIREATESLNYLLEDGVAQAIAPSTFSLIGEMIEKIQKNPIKKAELSKLLAEGKRQYDNNKKVEKGIADLFFTQTTLNPYVTQSMIDSLKEQLEGVVNESWRRNIGADLIYAQYLLNEQNKNQQEQIAKVVVNNLFSDRTHASLNTKTTQATIDGAKKAVDALPASETKTQLIAEIKKAQELLDKKNEEAAAEKAAKEAVNNLFTDGTHTSLNTKTTQATIDGAKKAVDVLPSGETKTQLTAEIKKAQDLLDKKTQEAAAEKAARTAVNNLFTDDAHTTLKGNTTQETIDGAKKTVDALPAGETKTQLTAEIKKAQDLLDKKTQEAKAKTAVSNLFADDAHTALNGKTTQETIDGAKKVVDTLPSGEVKTQLTAEIKKAQDLLDKKIQEAAAEKAAKEAVNNLFTDDVHNVLNDKTTQATIDEAKKAVEALPSGEVKTQLTVEIEKAQDLLLLNESKITLNDYVMGIDRYVKGEILGKVIKKVSLEVNGELKKGIDVTTGSFQYWAVDQFMSDKDEVFVIGYDVHGNEVKRTKLNLIPLDSSQKVILTASSFVVGKDNYITGTYEGQVKTVALRIDGVLTQKIVVKDGVIKYYAKGKITNSSSKVELVAINALGEEVAIQTVKVSDIVASMKVNIYKLGESHIQGSYTGDAKYMSIEVNGRRLQTIGIANGLLKYYIKGKINSVDDKVDIILLDGNKTEIQRTPLKMISTTGTLTLDSYKLNAAYLTGTYTGDIVKVRVLINGVAQKVIPISNNKIQYYARNLITKEADTVIVEGLDAANNVLDSKSVEITK
ncbi:toxin Cry1Ac domain D-VI-related protein, partial [Enterococcus rotai]|uniref:toxin Cry1Ac domain D-VI-related protein n=1 Tax=Enterococcus rotai TaxID=118060 RepID=UPI0035C6A8C5